MEGLGALMSNPDMWMKLGLMLSQMGGAIGKGSNTPMGDMAAGISGVTGDMMRSQNLAKMLGMNQSTTTGGGSLQTPAPSFTQKLQPTGAMTEGAMTPNKLADLVHDKESNIASASWDPSGKFSVTERKPEGLALSSGSPSALKDASTGSGYLPFLEALRRM
jgi:hypothetical protein